MQVKFNKHYKGYNAGDVADFPPHVAKSLFNIGVCDKPQVEIEKVKAEVRKTKPATPDVVEK